MDAPTRASREALLYSLRSDTLLILSRAHRGESDHDIVRWSKSWAFTEERIEAAYAETCRVFGRTSRTREEARAIALSLYAECSGSGYMQPRTENAPTQKTTQRTSKEGVMNDVDEGQLDAVARIALLTAQQRDVLSMLAHGIDDDVIKERKRISQQAFDEMVGEMFDFLNVGKGEVWSRRRALAISAFNRSDIQSVRSVHAVAPSKVESAPVHHKPPPRPIPTVVRLSVPAHDDDLKQTTTAPFDMRQERARVVVGGVDVNASAFKKAFCANVRAMCTTRGISEGFLLKQTDLSSAFISSMRAGAGSRLDSERIGKIAQALNVPANVLLRADEMTVEEVARVCAEHPFTMPERSVIQRRSVVPVKVVRSVRVQAGGTSHLIEVFAKNPEKAAAFAKFVEAWHALDASERTEILRILTSAV